MVTSSHREARHGGHNILQCLIFGCFGKLTLVKTVKASLCGGGTIACWLKKIIETEKKELKDSGNHVGILECLQH